MANTQVFYAAVAILGGIAVPFLASINAAYGQAIGNVYWASLTLCIVAFLTILLIVVVTGGAAPSWEALRGASWWHFTAGCFFTIYVVAITYVAPKIGVGNAIIFVVVAQIFTAVIIDHFGFFGATVQQLDWKRALGVVFLVAGVALAKSQTSSAAGG